jgi:hypothetical protein
MIYDPMLEKNEYKEAEPRSIISAPTLLCPGCQKPMQIAGKENIEKTSGTLRKSKRMVPHLIYRCENCKTQFHLNLEQRGGGCFIATAAFETSMAHEVNVLRSFRDNVLMREKPGQKFISFYYTVSPHVAKLIEKSRLLRLATRATLAPVIRMAKSLIGF